MTKNLAIDGHKAAAIHGNKSQNARQAALKGFTAGQVRILVATDIAARGIDVPNITHVINYELPDDAENYVHRIGRTARNGASGFAITLCDGTERGKLRDVERLIRRTLPVSGELKGAEAKLADAVKGHRGQGRPQESRRTNEQRPQRNAGRHFSGAKKAAIVGERAEHKPRQQQKAAPRRETASAPTAAPVKGAWWEKPTGSGNPVPPKARWSKGQKDVAKAKRSGQPQRQRQQISA